MAMTYAAVLTASLVAAATIGAAGGAVVATWKADAEHGKVIEARDGAIRELEQQITELKLAIAEQNTGVAVAEAQTAAATQAREQAQKHAGDLAALSKSRFERLERVMADTSEQVLKAYWEMRR